MDIRKWELLTEQSSCSHTSNLQWSDLKSQALSSLPLECGSRPCPSTRCMVSWFLRRFLARKELEGSRRRLCNSSSLANRPQTLPPTGTSAKAARWSIPIRWPPHFHNLLNIFLRFSSDSVRETCQVTRQMSFRPLSVSRSQL